MATKLSALDYLDIAAAVLCAAGFVVTLVRTLTGTPANWWVLVSLPLISLLAIGRIGQRHKRQTNR